MTTTTRTNPPVTADRSGATVLCLIGGFLALSVLFGWIAAALIYGSTFGALLAVALTFRTGGPYDRRKPIAAKPVETISEPIAVAIEETDSSTESTAPVTESTAPEREDQDATGAPNRSVSEGDAAHISSDDDSPDATEEDPQPTRVFNEDVRRAAEIMRAMLIESRAGWVYVTDAAERIGVTAKALVPLCESDGLSRVTDLRKLGGPQRAAYLLADIDAYLDDGTDTRDLFSKPQRHLRAV